MDTFYIIREIADEARAQEIKIRDLSQSCDGLSYIEKRLRAEIKNHEEVDKRNNKAIVDLMDQPQILNKKLNAIEEVCNATNIDKMNELPDAPAKVGHLVRAYKMVSRTSGATINKHTEPLKKEIERLKEKHKIEVNRLKKMAGDPSRVALKKIYAQLKDMDHSGYQDRRTQLHLIKKDTDNLRDENKKQALVNLQSLKERTAYMRLYNDLHDHLLKTKEGTRLKKQFERQKLKRTGEKK